MTRVETHRCHDRRFLLRFAKDRNGYRRRLREAAREVGVSILPYNITSHHVHGVASAENPEAFLPHPETNVNGSTHQVQARTELWR